MPGRPAEVVAEPIGGEDWQHLAGELLPLRRSNYLLLQENLADLRLTERRALATMFLETIEKVGAGHGLRRSWWTDSKPDFLYVLASVRGIPRADLLRDGPMILQAALAYHAKQRGMLLIDRDGESFEVCLADLPEARPALIQAANRYSDI